MKKYAPVISIVASLMFGVAYLYLANPPYNGDILLGILLALGGGGIGEAYRQSKLEK